MSLMKTQNYVPCINLFILNPPPASLFELSEMEQLEDKRKTALNPMAAIHYWRIITDKNTFDTHNAGVSLSQLNSESVTEGHLIYFQ